MNTKGDIINRAVTVLGIGGTLAPVRSNVTAIGLSILESMVASWENNGIFINYRFSEGPKLNQFHAVGRQHWNTLVYNLAMRLCADLEIQPPAMVQRKAAASMSATLASITKTQQRLVEYPGRQPIGTVASLKISHLYRFYPESADQEALREFVNKRLYPGDQNIFVEDFTDVVSDDKDEIKSVAFDVDSGLTVVYHNVRHNEVVFAIKADENYTGDSRRTYAVQATFVSGKIETRVGHVQVVRSIVLSRTPTIGKVPDTLPVTPKQRRPFPPAPAPTPGGGIIMADARRVIIPDESPFEGETLRDNYYVLNYEQLRNSTEGVTVVYVFGIDTKYTNPNTYHGQNPYTLRAYQWFGHDQPSSYDSGNWGRIDELSQRQVRDLYEANYTADNNKLGDKSNAQMSEEFDQALTKATNADSVGNNQYYYSTNSDNKSGTLKIKFSDSLLHNAVLNKVTGARFRISEGSNYLEGVINAPPAQVSGVIVITLSEIDKSGSI